MRQWHAALLIADEHRRYRNVRLEREEHESVEAFAERVRLRVIQLLTTNKD